MQVVDVWGLTTPTRLSSLQKLLISVKTAKSKKGKQNCEDNDFTSQYTSQFPALRNALGFTLVTIINLFIKEMSYSIMFIILQFIYIIVRERF